MDCDFDESLPSDSNFYMPARHQMGQPAGQSRSSYDYSSYMDTDNHDRSASPPPPPPPIAAPVDVPNRRQSEPTSRNSSAAKKGGPTFPFLKKNSRKEPSALHRSPRSPDTPSNSSTKESSSSYYGRDQEDKRSAINRNGSAINTKLYAGEEGDDFDPDEEHDILLTGTGYWPTEDLKAPAVGGNGTLRGSAQRAAHHQSGGYDNLDTSTINIAGAQWQEQRDAGQEELDEFELIEQQLANSSLSNTIGAVNKSLASSVQFVPNQASLATKRAPPPAAAPNHVVDDWSDAYEHDEVALSTIPHGKEPSLQSCGNGFDYNPSDKEEDLESRDRTHHRDEDSEDNYAEDFNSEDDREYPNRMKEGDSSPSGVRQSTSAYLESIRRDVHDFEESNTKRASRPTFTEPSDLRDRREIRSSSPDAADRNPWQTSESNGSKGASARAPVLRNADSPSWGRSTQPVQNSFSEGDYGSEYDDARNGSGSGNRSGGLSRTTDGSKVARMSNSALRKISSRAAALQNNTPQSRVERPALADDGRPSREEFSDPEEASVPEVKYTRPAPVRRSLASTHSAPAASTAAKPRSSSTGGRLRPGAPIVDTSQAAVVEKVQQLENEMQTYRNENANLKRLRKQQEASLAEVVHQKEEVMRWVAEEKAKTARWCEEQTAAATKERNAAAKAARESRQKALTGTVPIRKEKAEIEGLQATIEKMKLDHDAATKKWKLAEARLYSVIKEHTSHIESTEKQLLTVEEEKLMLLEYIGEQGLRLPKELRSSLQRTPLYRSGAGTSDSAPAAGGGKGGRLSSTTGSSLAMDVVRGKSPGNRDRGKYQGDRGYAEEVDVEFADATSTSSYHPTARAASGGASSSRPATPNTRNSARLSATTQPGDVFNRQSNNIKAGSVKMGARVAEMVGANPAASTSWARSSRSSHGSAGRYDGADEELDSDMQAQARERSEERTVPSASQKVAPKSTSPRGQPDLPTAGGGSHSHSSGNNMSAVNLPPQSLSATGAFNPSATRAVGEATAAAGRVEETLPGGKKLVKYKNGTEKEIDDAGNSLVRFLNGDTKSVNATSGVVVYYYAQADTTHTTFKDGLEVYEFPNKQVEMHFPDGIKEIIFPDSTRKIINPDGLQESHFPDGVILREHADGRREVLSGTKEA